MRFAKIDKVVLVVMALFFLGACQGRAVEIGKQAPDFSLDDTEFNTLSLADYKGKVIILNFFATWCPPCRAEIPDFIDMQSEYASRGVAFIGVSNERTGTLREFVSRMGINYPVLEDSARQAFTRYGPIRGVPMTFVIGKDMKIYKIYIGARSRETIEQDIKDLLGR